MIYSFKRPYAVRGERLLDCTLPTVGWRVDSGPEAGNPLLKAPMVMKEVNRVPVEKRVGPIIVSEGTGLPYLSRTFAHG